MLYKDERMFYNGKERGGDVHAGETLFLRIHRPPAGETAVVRR